MLLLAADEKFYNDIVRGLLRRKPDLDIVRIQDLSCPVICNCRTLYPAGAV